MLRISLRALFGVLAIVSIAVAILFVPRGAINRSAALELKNGMSIQDASEIIGLRPGWYDGIYGVSQINLGNKIQRRVAWINLNGAIVADIDDGKIQTASFSPASSFATTHDFGAMLYDRTIQRAIDSNSPSANVLKLFMCFLISVAPILLLGRILNLNLTELTIFAGLVACVAYIGLSYYLHSIWNGHHNDTFALLAIAVIVSAFGASCLLAAVRIGTRNRNKRMSEESVG